MKEKTGKLSIKEWAEEDRPREKMLQKGASVLSDAELIAILIGSGNNEETAVQLSQRILHSVNNNLNTLGKRSIKELTSGFKGGHDLRRYGTRETAGNLRGVSSRCYPKQQRLLSPIPYPTMRFTL